MTSLKVVDGSVALFVTLSAEYTNEETEWLLETERVRVPRDHPLVRALVDIWHRDEQTGKLRASNPMNFAPVHDLEGRLAALLAEVLE